MKVKNETWLTEFILEGFPGSPLMQISLFGLFFMTYLVTLMGNILIIVIIYLDYRLHTPMYFFLANLSFLETCCISVIVPKLLILFVSEKKVISYEACLAQSYFYFYLSTTDFLLLSVMSIDRYVAICRPLHYSIIMSSRVCAWLVIGCWISSFLFLLLPTVLICRLPFCGPKLINHFFCDSSAMLALACADTRLIKVVALIVSSVVLLGSLALTTISYMHIISTILKKSSRKGRQRTFSTCASHLCMVSITFGSAIFIEVRPMQKSPLDLDKIVVVISSVLAPLLNPFIYTLRNVKVKEVLKDTLGHLRSRHPFPK
ncbi:olfactory receptor 6M1-like [Rhinatrema bivittatum]|uniref:olfactory receptor 6M1-like n=1 Tax=Rhinatrema bivittatum TaxID=194408 RepID=UPI00112DDA1F|nr:olfactory receptor 6M1-like [Rhinatrema bivittatum]